MEPLREEVESIIAEEGWSKASIGKMRKLDSFLKESMRLADGSLRKSHSLPPPLNHTLAADDGYGGCVSNSQ